MRRYYRDGSPCRPDLDRTLLPARAFRKLFFDVGGTLYPNLRLMRCSPRLALEHVPRITREMSPRGPFNLRQES